MSLVCIKNLTVHFPIYKSAGKRGVISRSLGRNRLKSTFEVLSDVSFELDEGDRVALIGKNGAGKSTLLQVLAGLLPPSKGEVMTKGEVFPFLTPAPGLLVNATCLQNIVLQGLQYGFKGEEMESYIESVVSAADLGDFINSPVSNLSAGMRSRFSISTLSGVKPELLFLDEWIGTADNKVLGGGAGLLGSLVEKSKLFVIASHRKDIVRAHCNKAIVLSNGKLKFIGQLEKALNLVDS